jgi:hypothetical protein
MSAFPGRLAGPDHRETIHIAMIAALFLSVLPHPIGPIASPLACVQEAGDAEVDAKIAEAGTEVAKLLELAKSFSTAGKDDAAKKVYKKIVELDPKHEEAHKALRHHFYDGKWFESYAELSKYRREETAKMKEKGLARWKDQWVPEGDVPYLNMGWVKDEAGTWTNPVVTAQRKQIAEWQAKGYSYRADDSSWIAPEDKDKWSQLLWKCGDQWLDQAKANEYHAQIPNWWQLDGDHYSVWSTCDWQTASAARWHADKTYADMVRLFGVEPDLELKPHVVVLNSLEQYNQAAGGQPPLIPEREGFSSLHGAYFADLFASVDPNTQAAQYLGCGVSYWDQKDEKLKAWGPFWTRWAAAQSYCESIDPSWLAISEAMASQGGGGGQNTFWTEKKIPRWLRYGAASYAERFLKSPNAGDGGNIWELREFAFDELKKGANLHKMEDIFAFNLSLDDMEGSSRLFHEVGLVVSFLLDGSDSDKKLREKHSAFKAALGDALAKKTKTKELTEAIEALQKELAKNERDIKKFAGL